MQHTAYKREGSILQIPTSKNARFNFPPISQVYFFVGHIIMTMVLAVFCTLLFESPFIGLEKIAMGGGGRKRPERTQENVK